jgi:hypothetical protein
MSWGSPATLTGFPLRVNDAIGFSFPFLDNASVGCLGIKPALGPTINVYPAGKG